MTTQKSISAQFEISSVPSYIKAESHPEQSYYFFTYKITIRNTGTAPAQLVSRHWIITDSHGHTEEVSGPGVIGLQPKIQPGQFFEYESACPLNTASGSMRGRYQMVSDLGEKFEIEIPEFYLLAPQAIH